MKNVFETWAGKVEINGLAVRQWRYSRGIDTAKKLAELSRVGLRTIQRWEALGAVTADIETVRRVAAALQADVRELLTAEFCQKTEREANRSRKRVSDTGRQGTPCPEPATETGLHPPHAPGSSVRPEPAQHPDPDEVIARYKRQLDLIWRGRDESGHVERNQAGTPAGRWVELETPTADSPLEPAATGDRRPGYLLGQPFWVARPGPDDDPWAMAAHEAEPRDDQTALPSAVTPPPNAAGELGGRWDRTRRDDILRLAVEDRAGAHVGLVCGAGLGKTTTLQWLETAINRREAYRGEFLAYFDVLEKLSADPEDLASRITDKIAATLANATADPVVVDPRAVREHVGRLRREGRIVLLLDSLDQAGPDPAGTAVNALMALLSVSGPWRGCRVWVSGRPYAFRRAGPTFQDCHPNVSWQFVRVGQLDEPECRLLLETAGRFGRAGRSIPAGRSRFDRLPAAGQRLARVPRYGRLMADLPEARLAELTTEATILWAAYTRVSDARSRDTGLLDAGLMARPARQLGRHHVKKSDRPRIDASVREFQVRLAHAILGAAAFEMFAQGSRGKEPHPVFEIGGDVSAFVERVRTRLARGKAYRDDAGAILTSFFRTDWAALMAMDSHGLKHFIFSTTGQNGPLRWTDVSTAAYFAAYWACRWGNSDEWDHARCWIVDPLTEQAAGFQEFWEFALDLPAEAIEGDRWEHLFSLPYARATAEQPAPIRSTEFIYRSWERMRDTQAQADFLTDPRRELLTKTGTWRKGFIPLAHPKSKLPDDTGTFVMGAPPDEDPEWDGRGDDQKNPLQEVRLTRFCLHQYCVTNREYEVFDPRHKDHRWVGGRHPSVTPKNRSADDECPVVNVSWYDAWCFAKWVGVVRFGKSDRPHDVCLPSEAQWEYACRAGRWGDSYTPFTFDVSHPGVSVTPDVCNFDGNHLWPAGTELPKMAEVDVYRERTIPVAALGPNRWGFYQLHGNVWEWCTDWYWPGFYRSEEGVLRNPVSTTQASWRVLRGGGWFGTGWFCRSASRYWFAPGVRDLLVGFRLAAVPVVGAESGV
ncbi:MAG TPA: SUMF1/EgtB/PvdO family nonheme iron enzyme [Urbifossiella sp.]|nr:SUMF1/EgtB/PvdO family nonheme iron enzyme [Urbifossiella sp.]